MADRRCHMQYIFDDLGANYGDYLNFMANYFFHNSNTQPNEGGG